MAAATASTSTGVILATGSFGQAILNMGTAPLSAAMKMTIKQRMGLIPYEAIVGGTMTIVATLMYGFLL